MLSSLNKLCLMKTTPSIKVFNQLIMTKKTIGKPHPRIRMNTAGEMTVRVSRLKKHYKWKDRDIRRMMAFINRHVSDVSHLPESERLFKLQQMLDEYIKGLWGLKVAEIRNKYKARRQHRVKRRAITKVNRKMLIRQLLEDYKERQVINKQQRALRQAKGENFSFKKYLRSIKESQLNNQSVIYDEIEFENFLKKEIDTKFINGPASGRRYILPTVNYKTMFQNEVLDPMFYFLRKKAYLTNLVQNREDALRNEKVRKEIQQRRQKKEEERVKQRAIKKAQLDEIMNEWNSESEKFKTLKYEYFLARQKIYAESRKEYLRALDASVSMWKETPDECKFMRFSFGDGVIFPFRNTHYR